MERVALYTRVSTEEQARRGLSLAEQEHVLEEYAKSNGMKIIGRYQDAGISARKRYTKRPELLRLLEDVKAGQIDTILFIKLDRWFRSIGDYYEVQRILDEHRVAWRATQEDYETVTASGRFKVNIMLSVAQDEADRTSERIKFVFDGKRERGEPAGGELPIGYRKENKKVVLDEEKAAIVRKVFDIYLETGSPAQVINRIPELQLNRGYVTKILTNPAYLGKFQGIDIPAIISQEERDRVLAARKNYARYPKRGNVYLFTGLVFCAECGQRFCGRPYYLVSGQAHMYYGCTKHINAGPCQNKKHINEQTIEQYLLEHIDSKVESIAFDEKQKQNVTSSKPKRDVIARKLTKLSELYVNDLIGMDDYRKQYQALQDELAAIPEDQPAVNVKKLQETFSGDWMELYAALCKEDQKAFWRSTLKSITVNDGKVIDFAFS